MKFGDLVKNMISFKDGDEYEDAVEEAEELETENTDTDEDDDAEDSSPFASQKSTQKKSPFSGYSSSKSRNTIAFDEGVSVSRDKGRMEANAFLLTNIREAREAAQELMSGTMLFVKFDEDEEVATRLFHFLFGVVFAIDAKFVKTKDNTYIFYPRNASVGGNNIAEDLSDDNIAADLDL